MIPINSIEFQTFEGVYRLTRMHFSQSTLILFDITSSFAPKELGQFVVTNEAVCANLIFYKIMGRTGTAGDTADIRNMIALLTQG